MRITRDLLLNTARDTVKRQTFGGHDLICVYLTGSLIYDQPLLGGVTDIDLIYVHSGEAPCSREIIPITDDIHLDIAHFSQTAFSQPKKMRTDAWLGSFLCRDPMVLYDTQHWFEYTQAGVAASFYQPINVIQRVKFFSNQARSAWLSMQADQSDLTPTRMLEYLKTLRNAANAIACLTSVPLTDRRFLIDLPQRAQSLQMPGLAGGLIDLILPVDPIEPDWETWLMSWKASYTALLKKKEIPIGLINGRFPYYEKAIVELSGSNQQAALWIMLWTWTWISSLLPVDCLENTAFNNFCAILALDRSNFSNRIDGLDTYLDTIEEVIDNWSYQNGL